MKKSKVNKLAYGLYRIYWKSGGTSLAAVGGCPEGNHWMAPTNWISGPTTEYWHHVKKVDFIASE